jgi:hypothetical protein
MTPEAIQILLDANQADLNDTSRWVAELNKKWDRLQEERTRLLRLQREVNSGQAHR